MAEETVEQKTGSEEPARLPTLSKNGKVMGRPKGSKNKDTLFKELMTGHFQEKAIGDIEKVYEVLFSKAHQGDMKAIKMVLDRVVPVTKAVDAAAVKGGISVQVNVGSMEAAEQMNVEVIDDADYEVIDA